MSGTSATLTAKRRGRPPKSKEGELEGHVKRARTSGDEEQDENTSLTVTATTVTKRSRTKKTERKPTLAEMLKQISDVYDKKIRLKEMELELEKQKVENAHNSKATAAHTTVTFPPSPLSPLGSWNHGQVANPVLPQTTVTFPPPTPSPLLGSWNHEQVANSVLSQSPVDPFTTLATGDMSMASSSFIFPSLMSWDS